MTKNAVHYPPPPLERRRPACPKPFVFGLLRILMNKQGNIFLASSDIKQFQPLEADPQVLQMRVQAKFMNGDLTYNRSEFAVLEQWIRAHPQINFKEMFEKIFLPRRDRNAAEYKDSTLYKLLNR